ncbi:hypothetical protein [Streptomyces sp. AC512_CC834]|nr:hypothetical protein [Streptomyces sp. AC512_CC834]
MTEQPRFGPGFLTHVQGRDATEVAPALAWRPAARNEPAPAGV